MMAKCEAVREITWNEACSIEKDVLAQRMPCLLKNYDVGDCVNKWTVDYLCKKGGSRSATVHVSESPKMNFLEKNFSYRKLPFCDVVRRASEKQHKEYFSSSSEYYYFRSLGENARKDRSVLSEQFPDLIGDIRWPQAFPREAFFSSVFRIASADMQLWTHYDVMDNFLIQVNGTKRVVLFSPEDALKLYLHGDKSTIVDIDNVDLKRYPKFADAQKFKCILHPGDILFIPALWFHNVVSLEFGIAVNVFWRHLPRDMYDGHDVYGNKDLIPAARSLNILNRALKVLETLPEDYRDFYGRKLIGHIENNFLSKH